MLVGEVARCKLLRGELPVSVPSYPDRLAALAPARWRDRRDFSLRYADMHAKRDDSLMETGMRARAAIEDAHAVMAERREWVLNEKGLLARAA